MIAMTNANMKNLPTTPPPAPEKTWDKESRAHAAAVKALGPQAIKDFDYTVIRNGKRFVWKRVAEDDRRPVSDAQVKANGGKRAVDALLSAPDRIAGEMVASAAVKKIMAAAKKPTKDETISLGMLGPVPALDTTEDENGMPKFLKREGKETDEQKDARIASMKKVVGPERKISNPPNAKDAKKRADKEKTRGVGHVAREAILAGKTNAEALAAVMKVFPKCSSNVGCMSWYRNKLRKDGLLKDGKTTARPTKKVAKK